MPTTKKTQEATVHEERETDRWSINVEDHPARKDSHTYTRARALMVEIAKEVTFASPDHAGPFYGGRPWQDHHSGVLWVHDNTQWLAYRNLAGLEWSSQFCADPAKVELLRLNAVALIGAFPKTLSKLHDMGYQDQVAILNKTVETAEDVANYVDSIFNASMPLPQPVHTGVIKPDADGSKPIAGIHYYPLPVWDIQFVKHDDFCLWVTDEEGHPAAVVPTAHRGEGEASVEVVHAQPGSKLEASLKTSHESGHAHVLDAQHPLAKQAFKHQVKAK